MKNYLLSLLVVVVSHVSYNSVFAARTQIYRHTNFPLSYNMGIQLTDTIKRTPPALKIKKKKKKDTLQAVAEEMPALKVFVDGLEKIAQGIISIFK